MHFIQKCPSCRKKIRFPINKGKIKVSCTCGYSFLVNPDDPETFKKGKFDIGSPNKGNSFFKTISKKVSEVKIDNIKSDIINNFLKLKYKIQNYKLLPAREQRKLFIILLAITLIILIILFKALSISGVSKM